MFPQFPLNQSIDSYDCHQSLVSRVKVVRLGIHFGKNTNYLKQPVLIQGVNLILCFFAGPISVGTCLSQLSLAVSL